MMRWCFDLDNTLVKTRGSDYESSTPIPEAVAKVQAYKDRGDHIIIIGKSNNNFLFILSIIYIQM